MKLIAFMNSYTQGVAGGDIWLIEVLKELKKLYNVNIIIVTSKLGKILCEEMGLKNVNYIITTNEDKIKNIMYLYFIRIIKAIFKINLKTSEEDILIASSTFLPDVLPILFKKGKKIAIFHMAAPNPIKGYRGMYLNEKQYSLRNFRNFLRCLLYWLNEKISLTIIKIFKYDIFTLPTVLNYLIKKYNISKNRIHITLNGVNINFIKNIKASNIKKYDACWVGRAHPQKGIVDLFKAWKIVTEKLPNASLAVIGSGTENYLNIIKNLNILHNAELKGFVSQEEKFKIMKESKLFIFPSYYESFGIVVLEALACGLPVIAYDLPIYKEIYNNLLITVPVGNWKMLAETVIDILEDTRKRESIIKKASKIISGYSWTKIAVRFWEEINKC